MMATNASQMRPDQRIHSLLVGPSGAGKTAAALTFPGKSIVLDWDDRAKGAIEGSEFLQAKRRAGDIEVYRIMPWIGKTCTTLKMVYSVLEKVDARVTSGEVQNVIADGTTSMRRFFVNDSMNNELKTSGKASSLTHFQIGEAIMTHKQDHNYAATCMLNIIYENMKTWNCNLFLSTHIRDKVIASPTQEDPERVIVVGETITAPGQLVTEIPGWFNEVWEFQLDSTITSQPPRRYVVFQGKWARTSFRNLGYWDSSKKWVKAHRLDITDKSLYEVLKPTLDRLEEDRQIKP